MLWPFILVRAFDAARDAQARPHLQHEQGVLAVPQRNFVKLGRELPRLKRAQAIDHDCEQSFPVTPFTPASLIGPF